MTTNGMEMTEYKIGNAIVRMHGTPDLQKIKAAAEQFFRTVEQQKAVAVKGGAWNALHG